MGKPVTTPELVEQITSLLVSVQRIEHTLVQLPAFNQNLHHRFKIALQAVTSLAELLQQHFDWEASDTVSLLADRLDRAQKVLLSLSTEYVNEWLSAGESLPTYFDDATTGEHHRSSWSSTQRR